MTAALLDVFAFLSVLLRGAALTLNSLAIGGAAFLAWALRGVDARDVARPARRMVTAAAAGLAIVQASILARRSSRSLRRIRRPPESGSEGFPASCWR